MIRRQDVERERGPRRALRQVVAFEIDEDDDDGKRRKSGVVGVGLSRAPVDNRMPIAQTFDEDDIFDNQLPRRLRMKSAIHFTPVAVARLAARLLAPRTGMRVLDVGAGPGKFCIVAAREVPSAIFVGVEIRPHLVRVARRLVSRAGISNARFIDGNAMEVDWTHFDAFYLYNPFAEQLRDDGMVLDRSLTFMPSRFFEYVRGVTQRLSFAPVGTRVVTYHSLGASPPQDYDLVESHAIGTDRLELWVKTRHDCNVE